MCTKTGGCTKKELVEWLEANVPDDAEIQHCNLAVGTFKSLDLSDFWSVEYIKETNSLLIHDL